MSALPPVSLNLSDFARPTGFSTEWVYGPARNDWLRSHPITAYGDAEEGEPTVEFSGPLGLTRDQLPHLIAWMAAVYAATEPPVAHGPGKCACGGNLPVSTHSHSVASCVAGGAA